MPTTTTLADLAKTIRSKNAGTDRITFDVIFPTREVYERVRHGGVLTRETVAALFRVEDERIVDFVNFDPAFAIKFTLSRTTPSGGLGEGDIFGCQQYPPLLDIEVPAESAR
ncbi:DUF4387 domain-containing protein [Actinomadura sp. WMMB 499]|uniref:DUF4387 domain-containing protein n=1 Tax=Actinomadura sp. WMMB 499 TaxID=1219491 RepID=UPI001247D7DA|nr:DUF4387 domain-containing protein [Actinomadura sp. WMMB 499]QFG22278.1 DUF4387 domain-containing protein [Actinomadura sp. WMMB 499]